MFKINYSRKLRRQLSLADSADAYTAKKGEVGKRRRKGGRERRRRLLLMDGGRWEGRKGRSRERRRGRRREAAVRDAVVPKYDMAYLFFGPKQGRAKD